MRVIFCGDAPLVLEQLCFTVSAYFAPSGGNVPEFACYHSGEALLNAAISGVSLPAKTVR